MLQLPLEKISIKYVITDIGTDAGVTIWNSFSYLSLFCTKKDCTMNKCLTLENDFDP